MCPTFKTSKNQITFCPENSHFISKIMADFVLNKPVKDDVTHVIFDMDGLLLATEDLYAKAATEVAEKFARNEPKKVTWEMRVLQMGLQKQDLAEFMGKSLFVLGVGNMRDHMNESKIFHNAIDNTQQITDAVQKGL